MQSSDDIFARLAGEEDQTLDELIELLRIPSISTDPAYADDVARCATVLFEKLEGLGFTTESMDLGGHPLIYAEWLGAPGRPTILFYGHYDVQPADPIEKWRNPPFEPTIEDGFIYARGATDDKAQMFSHLKAVEAMLAERGSLPVNVKFLIEGEEESGGHSILKFVRDDAGHKLACDAILISDSDMISPEQPLLYYGVRGIAYMELEVHGPKSDLHSGLFGGAVANPLNALSKILAGLTDSDGRIAIPGFYDDVLPLADWEREEAASLPHDEAKYCADLGIDTTFGEAGFTTLERIGMRPTCDVNGMWGGYQGAGQKTVLPASAGAKVSMRLVPNQDASRIAELFEQHVKQIAPPGVRVAVRYLDGGDGVLVDTEGPIVEAAMAAMEDEWGNRPLRARGGGSLPVVEVFADQLGVPVMMLGFGLPGDGLHAPNERYGLSQLYGGIRSVVRFLDRIP
ncbi:MAG: dipeptidase [Acidobacteriota bacterium]